MRPSPPYRESFVNGNKSYFFWMVVRVLNKCCLIFIVIYYEQTSIYKYVNFLNIISMQYFIILIKYIINVFIFLKQPNFKNKKLYRSRCLNFIYSSKVSAVSKQVGMWWLQCHCPLHLDNPSTSKDRQSMLRIDDRYCIKMRSTQARASVTIVLPIRLAYLICNIVL